MPRLPASVERRGGRSGAGGLTRTREGERVSRASRLRFASTGAVSHRNSAGMNLRSLSTYVSSHTARSSILRPGPLPLLIRHLFPLHISLLNRFCQAPVRVILEAIISCPGLPEQELISDPHASQPFAPYRNVFRHLQFA